MATELEKDVVRVSSEKRDDRNIYVTLSSDQKVTMKLKGMKTGELSIGISELYDKLSKPTEPSECETSNNYKKLNVKDPKVVESILQDLRSQNAISGLDYDTLVKFDSIISNLINSYK